MISDVLFEAREEIRRYQANTPEAYDDIGEQIDAVVKKMVDLQEYLDTPPVMDRDVAKWVPVVSAYMRLLENPNTPVYDREIIKDQILQLARIVDGDAVE
jgi:hypothetical protein